MGLGFLTESNKQFIRFGVTGPILKSTTEVKFTWAGRESKSPSQRAPVADTVKRGGGGGKVIQNKRRAKNDVEPRVHWTVLPILDLHRARLMPLQWGKKRKK